MATTIQSKTLTPKGLSFIRSVAFKGGLLQGTQTTYSFNHEYTKDEIYTSALYSGMTDIQYGEKVIEWVNKYSLQFGLDANILASQCYQESKFKTYLYSVYKQHVNAMGLTQFVGNTIYDMFSGRFSTKFTSDELSKITYNTTGKTSSIINRKQIHQNTTDNPEIMIKAQAILMHYIGNNNAGLASSTLWAYNRGSELRSKNYPEIITKTKAQFGEAYLKEGVGYVKNIFNSLNIHFGYNIDTTLDDIAAKGGTLG